MPLEKCTINNKSGVRWGSKGRCYVGPGKTKKALKQGYAENNGDEKKFKEEVSKSELVTAEEIEEVIKEVGKRNEDIKMYLN